MSSDLILAFARTVTTSVGTLIRGQHSITSNVDLMMRKHGLIHEMSTNVVISVAYVVRGNPTFVDPRQSTMNYI